MMSHKIIKSSTVSASSIQKRTMVQQSINTQYGHSKPNLRRHESAPVTDIDHILSQASEPVKSKLF